MLVLVPPQVWLERRLRGEFSGSLLAFYPHYLEGIYPGGNLSWHHLWFLLFLLVFTLAALPLFVRLRTPAVDPPRRCSGSRHVIHKIRHFHFGRLREPGKNTE